MNAERDRAAMDIVGELTELPAEARSDRLDALCRGDSALRERVVALLNQLTEDDACDGEAFHASTQVDRPAFESVSLHSLPPAPREIGSYRILGRIGAGAMGEVFEAEQDKPRRRVALKVIKSERLSRDRLRRFEYEAEWLGRLDHPGIARVYEAGSADTPTGRLPFFAMELVKGRRLDRWLAQVKPDLERRIKLLMAVCEAVQHAHQKGLIHRDLKPANILVTEEGEPKILDFGIARTFGDDAFLSGAQTMHTADGSLLGTLQYMSPEQATGDARETDTRSDVYSLGVIAYEMLAGKPPYTTAGQPLARALEMIRSTPAPPLSAADPHFRGDLETIVAKSLEKDRDQRYPTVADFVSDLHRYLTHRPIAARPPTRMYQLRKFVRRHRVLVVAVALLALSLIGGIVGTTWGLIRAERARRASETANAITTEVNYFLETMLRGADPAQAQGREVTLRQILDSAAAEIDQQKAMNPLVEASVRHMVGLTYSRQGYFDRALPLLKRAAELRERELGADHPDTLISQSVLGLVLLDLNQREEAVVVMKRVVNAQRHQLGADSRETLTTWNNLACALDELGRYQEGESIHRDALARRRALFGTDDPDTLQSLSNLGFCLMYQGRTPEAEPLLREAVEIRLRTLGPDHPSTLASMSGRAELLQTLGRFDESEPLYREMLPRVRRVMGENHINTLRVCDSYVTTLRCLARLEEAEALERDTLTKARQALGNDHAFVSHLQCGLGSVLADSGKHEEAQALFVSAVDGLSKQFQTGNPVLNTALNNYAAALMQRSDYAGAEAILRRIVGPATPTAPADRRTYAVVYNLARAIAMQGRWSEAEPILSMLAQPSMRDTGARSFALARGLYGQCLARMGRTDEAEPLLVEARTEMISRSDRSAAWRDSLDGITRELAEIYNRSGREDEARRLTVPASHPSTRPVR